MKDEDLQDDKLNETLDSLLTQTKNLLTKIEGWFMKEREISPFEYKYLLISQSIGVIIDYSQSKEHMTSQENLQQIIASLPSDTPEISVVVLKSQLHVKQKVSLSKNGNNQRWELQQTQPKRWVLCYYNRVNKGGKPITILEDVRTTVTNSYDTGDIFTLQDIYDTFTYRRPTLRYYLQRLRDEGLVAFIDNTGTYKMR